HGRCHLSALSTVIACGGGSARRTEGATPCVEATGLWPGGAVWYGLVRHRLSGAVAACLVADRGADCRAHRTDQHDGVYPPAVKRAADSRRVCARSADSNRPVARAQRIVADGRPDEEFLRNGRGAARGTTGRCKRHCCPQALCLGRGLDDFGLPADAITVR